MTDREKVIKGVHDARRYLEDREWVDKSVGVHIDALNDAIALLKEQEAFRCKDCAYALFKEDMVQHGHIVCTKPFTERWLTVKPDDWFCGDWKCKEKTNCSDIPNS